MHRVRPTPDGHAYANQPAKSPASLHLLGAAKFVLNARRWDQPSSRSRLDGTGVQMSRSRRHPTSPYLLRRLRSYEEACADRQGSPDEGVSDTPRDTRRREGDVDKQAE
jgi:hypothetical protein